MWLGAARAGCTCTSTTSPESGLGMGRSRWTAADAGGGVKRKTPAGEDQALGFAGDAGMLLLLIYARAAVRIRIRISRICLPLGSVFTCLLSTSTTHFTILLSVEYPCKKSCIISVASKMRGKRSKIITSLYSSAAHPHKKM